MAGGRYVDPAGGRVNLLDYWQQEQEQILDGLRPNVRRNYVVSWRVSLGPTVGGVRLVDLRASHVDAVVRECRRRGLAPSTINGTLNALSRVLAHAVREGRIEQNVVQGRRVKVPAAMPGARVTVDPDGVTAVAEAIDALVPEWGDPVRLAFWTGLRAEELWALQAGDVDFQARRITVRRAWTGTDEHGRVMGLPKSGVGRLVPIFAPVRDLLAARIEGLEPEEFVFVGERGRAVWASNYRTRTRWKDTVAKVGYPGLRFHDLRHSCASYLAGTGVPVSTVRAILGHGDVRVTQRYVHTGQGHLDAAIDLVAGKVG